MTVYLDENLSPAIAELLRQKGIDAISALEAGKVQLDDRDQFAYARREGRAIVTANVVDFIAIAHEAVATNTEHPGIVLIPSSFRGGEFQAIADTLFEILEAYRHGLSGIILYVRRG